jgi:hypothetical protein
MKNDLAIGLSPTIKYRKCVYLSSVSQLSRRWFRELGWLKSWSYRHELLRCFKAMEEIASQGLPRPAVYPQSASRGELDTYTAWCCDLSGPGAERVPVKLSASAAVPNLTQEHCASRSKRQALPRAVAAPGHSGKIRFSLGIDGIVLERCSSVSSGIVDRLHGWYTSWT